MARIRTIKPELWLSPQVMNLSVTARLLFIGLITQADDEGRGTADSRKLCAAIFPGDKISATRIDGLLDELAREKLVVVYEANDHGKCYAIPTWKRHQRVEKPRASNYPAPQSPNVPQPVGESSGKSSGGSDLILPEGTEGSLSRERVMARAREMGRKAEEQEAERKAGRIPPTRNEPRPLNACLPKDEEASTKTPLPAFKAAS